MTEDLDLHLVCDWFPGALNAHLPDRCTEFRVVSWSEIPIER